METYLRSLPRGYLCPRVEYRAPWIIETCSIGLLVMQVCHKMLWNTTSVTKQGSLASLWQSCLCVYVIFCVGMCEVQNCGQHGVQLPVTPQEQSARISATVADFSSVPGLFWWDCLSSEAKHPSSPWSSSAPNPADQPRWGPAGQEGKSFAVPLGRCRKQGFGC